MVVLTRAQSKMADIDKLKEQNEALLKQVSDQQKVIESLQVTINQLNTNLESLNGQLKLLLDEKTSPTNKRKRTQPNFTSSKSTGKNNNTIHNVIVQKQKDIITPTQNGGITDSNSMDFSVDDSRDAQSLPANNETIIQNDESDTQNETNEPNTNAMKNTDDSIHIDKPQELADDNFDWNYVSYKNIKQNNSKIQPIIINDTDIDHIHANLSRFIGKNRFNIKKLGNSNNVKIFCDTRNTHIEIMSLLRENKINFHTYLHKDEKKTCVLLKGLNQQSLIDIKYELIGAGLPDEMEIHVFKTGFMKQNTEIKHNSIYKIILPAGFDLNVLKKIKSLFGFIVTFEKLINNGIIQCHNCQGYHHTASRCFYEFRCVRCVSKHLPGKCNAGDSPPQCVNCDGLHTANNFQKCEFFKNKILPNLRGEFKLVSDIVKNKNIKDGNKTNFDLIGQKKNGNSNSNNIGFTSPAVRKNVSFADAIKDNGGGKKNKNESDNNVNGGSNSDLMALLTGFLKKQDELFTGMLKRQDDLLNFIANKHGN